MRRGENRRVARVRRALTALFSLLALAGVLAGCSTPSATKIEHGYEIGVGTLPGLGSVLVDVRGMTLYLYEPDRQGTSRCTRICAVQWPPLLTSGDHFHLGPGVNGALVGTVRRAGGALQVTYNRWPLYAFAQDGGPGQATGQGDDMGLWYVISPSGNAVH
jgi:predicted lipoprotein with Yx(FWY)xxD motif